MLLPYGKDLAMHSDITVGLSVVFFVDRQLNLRFLEGLAKAAALTSHALPVMHLLVFDNGVGKDIGEMARTKEHVQACGTLLDWQTTYIPSEHNTGFGFAHNANLACSGAEIFLVINNDVSFPNLDFIHDIVQVWSLQPTVGAVGAIDSPHAFTDTSGSAPLPDSCEALEVDYLEGSVLAVRTEAISTIGELFSNRFSYLYFEDADLSLRLRARGWLLKAIRIPHSHDRSSSTKTFPRPLIRAITERNRSIFLGLWGRDLDRQSFTRRVYFEICSFGMGDNLLASLIAIQEIPKLFKEGFAAAVVYLRTPGLAFLFDALDGVQIIEEEASPAEDFDRVYSLASMNYNSPNNLFDMIGAAWSTFPDWDVARVLAKRIATDTTITVAVNLPDHYSVLHIAQPRPNWEGRYPSAMFARSVIRKCLELGLNIVLIGDLTEGITETENVGLLDLRGSLCVRDLMVVIGRADRYFGPDSGPWHIAQLLDCPSFVILGATLASARVRESGRTWPYRAPGLSCHGCYHSYPGLNSNRCFRLDEACMHGFTPLQLEHDIGRFLAGDTPDWSTEADHLRRVQWHLALLSRSPYAYDEIPSPIDFRTGPVTSVEPLRRSSTPLSRRTNHDRNQAHELTRLTEELRTLRWGSLVASLRPAHSPTAQQEITVIPAVIDVARVKWTPAELSWKLINLELTWNGTSSAFGKSDTVDPRMTVQLPPGNSGQSVWQNFELSFVLFAHTETRTILFWTSDEAERFSPGKSLIFRVNSGLTPIRFLVSSSKIARVRLDPVEYSGDFYMENIDIHAWTA
jgi:GT2 family glycosyltransferase